MEVAAATIVCFLIFSSVGGGGAKNRSSLSSAEKDLMENRVKCLDMSFMYRKRPRKTMKIKTQVAILSIDSISSAKMELSADIYLIHEWMDHRYVCTVSKNVTF